MGKRDILKKITVSVITLTCLTAILGLLFQDDLEDIALSLKKLSLPDILWLFVLGASYQLLDAVASQLLVRTTFPTFPYHRALEVIYLGVFSKTSTLGVGIVPMQAYYLHRCGIEVGQGVGTMTFSYVLHKTAVLLSASVLLLFGGEWLRSAIPGLHVYLIIGYLICFGIILVLLLLCVWSKAHDFAVWIVGKLPEKGKWTERKNTLRKQLDHLYCGTTSFLKNKRIVLATFLTHTVKLLILCAVPHACIRMLGGTSISLIHVELLTVLILLIAGAIPNIAGIGPTEAGFFLMFDPLLGSAMTASTLLLFRISTYYFPFLVSVVVFLIVQTKSISKGRSKEVQKNENRSH